MKVWLSQSSKRTLLGECSTIQDIQKEINKVLDYPQYQRFKDLYQRWVGMGDEVMIDFGSHIDFIYLDCTWEEYSQLSKNEIH